jgi:hypothetical protein
MTNANGRNADWQRTIFLANEGSNLSLTSILGRNFT